MWYDMIWYHIISYYGTGQNIIRCSMVWHSNVWYNIVLWYGISECYMIWFDMTRHPFALLRQLSSYILSFSPSYLHHSLPLISIILSLLSPSFSPSSSIILSLFLYHSLPLPLSFPPSSSIIPSLFLYHSLPLTLSFPTSSFINPYLFLY